MSASGVTPLLRYLDPHGAAEWLCRSFDFKIRTIEHEADGSLRCIALDAGQSTIVIGPVLGTELDNLMVQPSDIGGGSTQTCYATVDDIEAHYASAKAAGASIVVEPTIDDDGNSYYLCHDPEGHLWSFGTHSFNADANALPVPQGAPHPLPLQTQQSRTLGRHVGAALGIAALLAGGSLIVYASTDMGGPPAVDENSAVRTQTFAMLRMESQKERRKRIAAEHAAREASKRHAEAVAVGAELKAALTDAQSALQVLRKRNMEIELSLQNSESSSSKELGEARTKLLQAEQHIASLNKVKTTALSSAAAAAKKLEDANELNRVLQEKLANAAGTIEAARQKNKELETTLAEVRTRYDQDIAASERRLKFASAELAKAARQLSDERKRAQVAERELSKTVKQLDATRSEAGKLSEQVAWLQTELKDSYANFRMRFITIPTQDVRLALASIPETIVKRSSVAVSVAETGDVKSAGSRRAAKTTTKAVQTKRSTKTKKTVKVSNNVNVAKSTKVRVKKKATLAKTAQRQKVQKATKPIKVASASQLANKPINEPAEANFGSTCARAVWSNGGRSGSRSKKSKAAIVNRLCAMTPTSAEPARCFQTLMSGKVNWGGGTRWAVQNAINLCAGASSATATIGCFKASVSTTGWREAVNKCSSG